MQSASLAGNDGGGGGILAALVRMGPSAQGGLLLVLMATIAFVWANSPWAGAYEALWATELTVDIGGAGLHKPLILWVNDGLMAVFFLLVGLEIKRELLEGTLSSPRKAALPLFAALGGMALPALIYFVINLGEGGATQGWAIPAATDIAFALGILALLGSRVPVTLKVFLTAVAVVDDLGAVLIIAVFLTESIKGAALGVAAGALVLLVVLNRMRVAKPLPYIVMGLVLWVAVLKSGVHATVAGVLLAMCIPASRELSPGALAGRLRELLKTKDHEDSDELAPDTVIHRVRHLCDSVESPLLRWEHALQPWVAFAVMPIFALANAGVSLASSGGATLFDPVPLGVALGLLLGKPIGITLFSWLAVRLGVSSLPAYVNWPRLHAAAWLGGIGFTMSLFIAGLALDGPALNAAKIGLLVGSLVAGVVGSVMLVRTCPAVQAPADPEAAQQGG